MSTLNVRFVSADSVWNRFRLFWRIILNAGSAGGEFRSRNWRPFALLQNAEELCEADVGEDMQTVLFVIAQRFCQTACIPQVCLPIVRVFANPLTQFPRDSFSLAPFHLLRKRDLPEFRVNWFTVVAFFVAFKNKGSV